MGSLWIQKTAAEAQICLNTQLSYGGVTPYQCLFGAHPRELFNDEIETVTSTELEDLVPFFRHQTKRLQATAAFQQALLELRLARAVQAGPRADLQQDYSVGMLVDVYRSTTRKDLSGWRGPCSVMALSGEGMITVKWQGIFLDVAIRNVRPHLQVPVPQAAQAVQAPAASAAPADPAPPVPAEAAPEDNPDQAPPGPAASGVVEIDLA